MARGCGGCGPSLVKPKLRRRVLGWLSFFRAKASGRAEKNLADLRYSLCHACTERSEATGDRLFREVDGTYYCGKPRKWLEWRDEYAEGCGCDLSEKARYEASRCPRRLWGPGNNLNTRKIKVIREAVNPVIQAGVHDLHVGTRTNPMDGTGLGDGLVSACIAEGIRRKHPERRVRIVMGNYGSHEWVRFFWKGEVIPDEETVETPGQWVTWAQHKTFAAEDAQARRHWLTRHQKFALHSGAKPVLPAYEHNEDALFTAQRELAQPLIDGKPIVFVVPFANNTQRMWPKTYSIKLVELLRKKGYWVGVIDGREGKDRTKEFPCMRYWGWGPKQTAGLFKYADLIIGLDSGMAHFGGCLGVPTLALCGPTDGRVVFGFYPTVSIMQAPSGCTACLYHKVNGFGRACLAGCEAMMNLKPGAVVKRAEAIISNKGVKHAVHA
jgi:hypothetical protein